MISKIDSVGLVPRLANNTKVKAASHASNSINKTSLPGARYSQSYQAMNGINFTGAAESSSDLTPLEESFIRDNEVRIPNVLDVDEFHLSRAKMPTGKTNLNQAGINLKITEETDEKGTKSVYTITNDFGDVIFVGKFREPVEKDKLPVLTYKQGKYMPEITVKDPSLNGRRVKMFAGSEIKGDKWELIMPGQYEYGTTKKAKRNISFTGNVVISTLNKEPRTQAAFNLYYKSPFLKNAIKGDYWRETAEYNPNVCLPMGGFGERFGNITRDKENKPSAKMPTDNRYRVMGTTLNLLAAAGLLNGKDDTISYLSQNHEIDGNNVYHTDKYKTDGGAFAEALKRGIIKDNKDTIILNGDIFTNADITRAYHALKTLPDAALVIPYYPVNPQRAKSFGLLGVEKDENGNTQIKNFVEKPKYTNIPPKPTEFSVSGEYEEAMEEYNKVQTALKPGTDDTYLANPGMYFLSEEASRVLMAYGIIDDTKTGLGKDVMPKIVDMANKGQLVDKNGNKLKVYTVPLEAKGGKPAIWEDIGTAAAYLTLIKNVARQTAKHGTGTDNKFYGLPEQVLTDFMNNTDLETGIVYGSQKSREAFNSFCEKYDVTTTNGNIFVTVD